MKHVFIFLCFTGILSGCTGNQSSSGTTKNDSLQSNKHDSVSAKPPVYTQHKKDCGFSEDRMDSSFVMDSTKVTVSISYTCEGAYVVKDTFCYNDTCDIKLYKNRDVHLLIKSGTEKAVIINKDFISKSLAEMDFTNCLVGTTTIDSVASSQKKIIFSTFIARPESDFGWYVIYSVSLDGQVEFIKAEHDEDDD